MGMPACRIGDLTVHGGTIIVGFPTVLIGAMPASRIGDMHVCPMVTPGVPPIPHVGGPFILGSPTVLVGMMPQSRVTDTLVCVGPPDQAVLGCMTVLVGMAGGAGAAGAAAGAGAMGVPVPVPAPNVSTDPGEAASSRTAQTRATQQADGSIQTASTVPGKGLPPIPLKQPGWPDLPAENTATFASVQPATVLPGTKLYAANDGDDPGSNSYWTAEPPAAAPDDAAAAAAENAPTNADMQAAAERAAGAYLSSGNAAAALAAASPALAAATHVAVLVVTSPGGLKGWAGTAAASAEKAAPGLLVYAPPEAANAVADVKNFRMHPAPKLPAIPKAPAIPAIPKLPPPPKGL